MLESLVLCSNGIVKDSSEIKHTRVQIQYTSMGATRIFLQLRGRRGNRKFAYKLTVEVD
jgi:hypothetical protein